MYLPALRQAPAMPAWRLQGVAMYTASTSFISTISRHWAVVFGLKRAARPAARSRLFGSVSQMATTGAPSFARTRLSRLPPRLPTPMKAVRTSRTWARTAAAPSAAAEPIRKDLRGVSLKCLYLRAICYTIAACRADRRFSTRQFVVNSRHAHTSIVGFVSRDVRRRADAKRSLFGVDEGRDAGGLRANCFRWGCQLQQ